MVHGRVMHVRVMHVRVIPGRVMHGRVMHGKVMLYRTYQKEMNILGDYAELFIAL